MTGPCSHIWIDPSEPPFDRQPYAPTIGPLWHEMKDGRTYRCLNCGQEMAINVAEMLRVAGVRAEGRP